MYIYIYVCVYIFICVCMYIYVCVCMYIYVCLYVYIYIISIYPGSPNTKLCPLVASGILNPWIILKNILCLVLDFQGIFVWRTIELYSIPLDIWMFPKIVVPPNHALKNRDFHYKPSILGGKPYVWKHPYIDS